MDMWILCLFTLLTILPQHMNSASLRQSSDIESHPRRHRKSRKIILDKKSKKKPYPFSSLPLQPSRTIDLPVALAETPNKDLDPNEVDTFELLNILGNDFDKNFMKVTEPLERRLYPDGELFYKFRKNQTPKGVEMPAEIAALSASTIRLGEGGPELKVKFSRRTKTKLQKFLWSYSYCPVRYKWKQLSSRFWPRWIKEGTCDNQRSCSIPAGMQCQPSKMTHIKLLRYYCPAKSPKSCTWLKMNYPILSECTCACDQQSS